MKIHLPALTPEQRSSLLEKGLHFLGGIIILIIAHYIGSSLKSSIYNKGADDINDIKAAKGGNPNDNTKQIKKTKLLFIILGQMAYYLVIGFAVLIVMKLLGIEATSIIAILGATGFTVGLALQGTLSDISSGVLLGLYQTYTIGDLIEFGDVKGRVKDFNLTRTILSDIDTNALIIVPNRLISESTLINHTRSEHRKVKFEINVSNSYTDFAKLIQLLKEELGKIQGVESKPDPPIVGVSDMGDVGTKITVKFFIATSDFPAIVLPIQSRIRQFLADNKVPMVDPF